MISIVAALLLGLLGPGGTPAKSRSDGAPVRQRPTPTADTTRATVPALPVWRVAWGSAMAWGYGTADDATVRDLAQVGIGGVAVRVRISNVFGNAPLVVGAASIGVATVGSAVEPGTLEPLTFSGQPTVTVPVGGLVYSDPVTMRVHALETLAVSLYVVAPDLVTVHPCCTEGPASYFTPNGGGDVVDALSAGAFAYSSPWGRFVDALDVLTAVARGSIVVVGDSITDGFNTPLRWTTVLQRRIDELPAPDRRAVVNEGITANTLTAVQPSDATTGGGPPGLERLDRDALSQSGVSEVVLFLGTNDLYFGATADQVIAGMQQAIEMAHAAHVRIIGVTILPRAGSMGWNPLKEQYREEVNRFIRTSGAFDGVLDLAAVVRDTYNGACDPEAMFPPYDSGDHLHPNAAGQTAMADAIDTSVLGLPQAPLLPELVSATPTPGCPANAEPAPGVQRP